MHRDITRHFEIAGAPEGFQSHRDQFSCCVPICPRTCLLDVSPILLENLSKSLHGSNSLLKMSGEIPGPVSSCILSQT